MLKEEGCQEWKEIQFPLHNTYHGGHIKMDHWGVMMGPKTVMERFSMPIQTSEELDTLMEVLDGNKGAKRCPMVTRLGSGMANSGTALPWYKFLA